MSHCNISSVLLYEKHQTSDCQFVFYLNRRESGIPLMYHVKDIGNSCDLVPRVAPTGTSVLWFSSVPNCAKALDSASLSSPIVAKKEVQIYPSRRRKRLIYFTALLDEYDSSPQYLKKIQHEVDFKSRGSVMVLPGPYCLYCRPLTQDFF